MKGGVLLIFGFSIDHYSFVQYTRGVATSISIRFVAFAPRIQNLPDFAPMKVQRCGRHILHNITLAKNLPGSLDLTFPGYTELEVFTVPVKMVQMLKLISREHFQL